MARIRSRDGRSSSPMNISAVRQETNVCSNALVGMAKRGMVSCTYRLWGLVIGEVLLVIVDVHSKWIEVCPSATATSVMMIGLPSSALSLRNLWKSMAFGI